MTKWLVSSGVQFGRFNVQKKGFKAPWKSEIGVNSSFRIDSFWDSEEAIIVLSSGDVRHDSQNEHSNCLEVDAFRCGLMKNLLAVKDVHMPYILLMMATCHKHTNRFKLALKYLLKSLWIDLSGSTDWRKEINI